MTDFPSVQTAELGAEQDDWSVARQQPPAVLSRCWVLGEFSLAGFPTGSGVIDSTALTAAFSTLH